MRGQSFIVYVEEQMIFFLKKNNFILTVNSNGMMEHEEGEKEWCSWTWHEPKHRGFQYLADSVLQAKSQTLKERVNSLERERAHTH